MYGQGNHPPLPKENVLDLKKKMLGLHPEFISSPVTSQKTQRQTEAKAVIIIKPQGRCEYPVTN